MQWPVYCVYLENLSSVLYFMPWCVRVVSVSSSLFSPLSPFNTNISWDNCMLGSENKYTEQAAKLSSWVSTGLSWEINYSLHFLGQTLTLLTWNYSFYYCVYMAQYWGCLSKRQPCGVSSLLPFLVFQECKSGCQVSVRKYLDPLNHLNNLKLETWNIYAYYMNNYIETSLIIPYCYTHRL